MKKTLLIYVAFFLLGTITFQGCASPCAKYEVLRRYSCSGMPCPPEQTSNNYVDYTYCSEKPGDSFSSQTLYFATVNGHIDVVKLLIEKGENINATYTTDGETLLHVAARNGQFDIVKLLVENGADLNAKDHDGWTALKHAKYKGHIDIANFLKEKGAAL